MDLISPSSKHYPLSIIGSCGLPSNYGGFETLAFHLVDELASENYPILIVSQRGTSSILTTTHRQISLPLRANGISSVPYDLISLFIAPWLSRAVLVLGVSGCIGLPFLRFSSHQIHCTY